MTHIAPEYILAVIWGVLDHRFETFEFWGDDLDIPLHGTNIKNTSTKVGQGRDKEGLKRTETSHGHQETSNFPISANSRNVICDW